MTSGKEQDSVDLESLAQFEEYIDQINISNFKSSFPKVNLKRLKLAKPSQIFNTLEAKNITNIFLNENLFGSSFSRSVDTPSVSSEENINPLRKKTDGIAEVPKDLLKDLEQEQKTEEQIEEQQKRHDEQKQQFDELLLDVEEESSELPFVEETTLRAKQKQEDITFNVEAEALQEEKQSFLTPTHPSVDKPADDLVSVSGKQEVTWPPVKQKKTKKKIKQKKKSKAYSFLSKETTASTKKKKPYFITKETVKPQPVDTALPWETSTSKESTGFDLSRGLEAELLDTGNAEKPLFLDPLSSPEPVFVNKEDDSPKGSQVAEEITKELIFKALEPNIQHDVLSLKIPDDQLEHSTVLKNLLDSFNKLDFGISILGKAGKMFDKFGAGRITPIRIIILGGALATIGYSAWYYVLPYIQNTYFPVQENKKVVVENLFDSKNVKSAKKKKKEIASKEELVSKKLKLVHDPGFTPITEAERFVLIQKARESLEGRIDPFGQEILIKKQIEEKKKIAEEEEATEIELSRKQIELIGVISTNNKNLALVNVYNADFTVDLEDDEDTIESKLKKALSKAVPNRFEVSLLDPIESWYVKKIVKAQNRADNPYIELVRGNQKFNLKVGQKVLLPEDEPS